MVKGDPFAGDEARRQAQLKVSLGIFQLASVKAALCMTLLHPSQLNGVARGVEPHGLLGDDSND